MTNADQSTTRPVNTDPTRAPRLCTKIGGAFTGLGLVALMIVGALMPSGETGQYEVAFGAALGDEKSQALILGGELGAVAVGFGLIILTVGVVWRLCVRKPLPLAGQ